MSAPPRTPPPQPLKGHSGGPGDEVKGGSEQAQARRAEYCERTTLTSLRRARLNIGPSVAGGGGATSEPPAPPQLPGRYASHSEIFRGGWVARGEGVSGTRPLGVPAAGARSGRPAAGRGAECRFLRRGGVCTRCERGTHAARLATDRHRSGGVDAARTGGRRPPPAPARADGAAGSRDGGLRARQPKRGPSNSLPRRGGPMEGPDPERLSDIASRSVPPGRRYQRLAPEGRPPPAPEGQPGGVGAGGEQRPVPIGGEAGRVRVVRV